MATKAAKKAASSAPAKTRRVKTYEERVAEAEAKLEALRSQAGEKAKARVGKIDEQLAKLEPKLADLQGKVDALKSERDGLVGEDEQEPGGTDGIGEPDTEV